MKRQLQLTLFFNKTANRREESDERDSVSARQDHAGFSPSDAESAENSLNVANQVGSASPSSALPKRKKLTYNPMDIGRFLREDRAPLTDEERYEALVNCWTPDENYAFPKVTQSDRSRAFQHHYLKRWSWLAYSEMHGSGALCKHCVLFSKPETCNQGGARYLGLLVSQPLSKYKKAIEIFNAHALCRYHCNATEDARVFLEWYKNPVSHDIRNRLVIAREAQVLKNRQRVIPIINTILLCGAQNFALRGHREGGGLEASAGTTNDGNFRALLRYRLDAGDQRLEEHLINAGKNATYLSGKFQNEVIRIIGKIIRKKIVAEVIQAKFFSVLADESRDIGKTDQLTVCIRYVGWNDGNRVLKEVFLKFCDVHEKTGAGLSRTILGVLEQEGLDVRYLRGQGYDGCSAMSGAYRGVQAEIKAVVPQALYFHCASHSLNLALVHSNEIVMIRLVAGTVASLYSFISSSSARARLLENHVETQAPESSKRRLKALCATRWVESHRAFVTFKELLIPIILSLRDLCNQNGETGSRAYQLLSALSKCEFICALFVLENFAALFLPLSVKLQAKDLDIFSALATVDTVLVVLRQRREESELEFRRIFEDVLETCDTLSVEVTVPRSCGRQQHRENHPAESAEDYFRASCYIQYLDSLIAELISLFADVRQNALKVQCLVPRFTVDSSFEDLVETLVFYESDLDCSPSILRGEFDCWKAQWSAVPRHNLPATAVDALNQCCVTDYPKIATLLQIFATFPVTTATPERTFSSLRRIKTYLRSVMEEKRLNGLASMSIQRDISVSAEEVIDMLALDPRKLDFVL